MIERPDAVWLLTDEGHEGRVRNEVVLMDKAEVAEWIRERAQETGTMRIEVRRIEVG